MEQLVQAKCPGCGKTLRIPSNVSNGVFRCKQCQQAMKVRGPAKSAAAPAAATNGVAASPPASTPSADLNPFLARLQAKRRQNRKIKLIILAFLAIAGGIATLIFWEDIQARYQNFVAKMNAKPGEKDEPELGGKASTSPISGTAVATTRPAPDPVPRSTDPNGRPGGAGDTGRRALLVGVKNYIYANALNPGYKSESITQDPLGFVGLRDVLQKEYGFPAAQIGELSDVAKEKASAPYKETIQETIKAFLENSRPHDRVFLYYMGHCAEVKEKAYLIPIEGDPQNADTLIPLAWFYEQLGKCKARQKFVVIDVAHLDPEKGLSRSGGEPLSAKVAEQIEKELPKGVQVWLSCSAGEHSYQFITSGSDGSVFMWQLTQACKGIFRPDLKEKNKELQQARKEREAKIKAMPGYEAGCLIFPFVVAEVNDETTKFIKTRLENGKQTPKLFGTEGAAPEGTPAQPAPAVAIVTGKNEEKLADARLIEDIVKELHVDKDNSRNVSSANLPPFLEKDMVLYKENYENEEDLKKKLDEFPLRKAVYFAITKLEEADKAFNSKSSFRNEANDAIFKKKLEREQEGPALIYAELTDALDEMEKALKARDKEKSKRWQAHFDFTYSRLLAKMIYVQEYNFVVGNKLRKDSPMIKNPANDGWNIIPQEKLFQKETKEFSTKRDKALERLQKDHPKSPWEILARREKSMYLGLTIQEAKVDN